VTGLIAVIPAGGSGTRLWPISRAAKPKFLLDLTGQGRTLIQQTHDRLAGLAQRIVVVTGQPHAAEVAHQLPQLQAHDLLIEPAPRDSMPAIGLAAAVMHQRHGDVMLGSFAADHIIRDTAGFRRAVAEAQVAAAKGYIATIGIEPTGPVTSFGYIKAGPRLRLAGAPEACQVLAFVEKPDLTRARAYLADAGYRWNAGMFVMRTGVLLDHLARLQPTLHGALVELAAAWDTDRHEAAVEALWPHLTKVAFDNAVAEPVAAEGGVATVPGHFDWDDLGDFTALASGLPKDRLSNGQLVMGEVATDAPLVVLDAVGNVVVRQANRVIGLIGLEDTVVVDTPDALLICRLHQVQRVKGLVDRMKAQGLDAFL